MYKKQSGRLPGHTRWMTCFLSALFWAASVVALPATLTVPDEVYHYREETGASVKDVVWRLSKDEAFTLTYDSLVERHVTTTGPDYDTRGWQVTADGGQTRFSAERVGRTIFVRGTFRGAPVDKRLEIDQSPWYQATSLSLRELVASVDSERVFWTIRMDTLTAHKIRAIKKGVEAVESDENQEGAAANPADPSGHAGALLEKRLLVRSARRNLFPFQRPQRASRITDDHRNPCVQSGRWKETARHLTPMPGGLGGKGREAPV
jgi:hypothetical protein